MTLVPGKGKKKPKNGVPGPQTVQAAVLPQQQKTPTPVDVNSKKPATPNGPATKENNGKKKKSKGAASTESKAPENHVNSTGTNNNTKTTKDTPDKSKRTSESKPEQVTNSTNRNSTSESQDIANAPIFTDYDQLGQQPEPEFETVTNKKKKKVASTVTSNAPTMNGNSRPTAWSSGQKAHSLDNPYDNVRLSRSRNDRNSHLPRSISPPITSTAQSMGTFTTVSTSAYVAPVSAPKVSSRVTETTTQRPGSAGNVNILPFFPSLLVTLWGDKLCMLTHTNQ